MSGVAFITTEEYKELIEAQCDGKNYADAFHEVSIELKDTRMKLDGLLLFITKGEKTSEWKNGEFEGYDLESKDEIAKYINKHFMKNGRLTVKENDND
jgi:phage pi2 protein 07